MKKYRTATFLALLFIVVTTTILGTCIEAGLTNRLGQVKFAGLAASRQDKRDAVPGAAILSADKTGRTSHKATASEHKAAQGFRSSTDVLNTSYAEGSFYDSAMFTEEKWKIVAVIDDHPGTGEDITVYPGGSSEIMPFTFDSLDSIHGMYQEKLGWYHSSAGQGSISSESEETDVPSSPPDTSQFIPDEEVDGNNDVSEGGAIAPVPEPSTMLLFGIGLLTGGFSCRKRLGEKR